MKKEIECEIVRDLLPNYIENLTSKETSKYLKEHIDHCEKCKKIQEQMQKEVELDTEKSDKKEINFLKKYKTKLNALKIIIFIFIIIFLLTLGRKMIILSNLSNEADKYMEKTNYHVIQYSYNEDSYIKTEILKSNHKAKLKISNIEPEPKKSITIYGKEKTMESKEFDMYNANIYVNKENKNTVLLNQEIGSIKFLQNVLKTDNWFELFRTSFNISVKRTTFNGKECFYITSSYGKNYLPNTDGIYVDAETGLVICENAREYINEKGEIKRSGILKYVYEFDSVTEEDFLEPDINDYEITEKLEF